MMPASVDRFCTIALRKVMTSSVINPAHASTSATQLVSMITSVCLRWIDVPWNRRRWSAPLLIASPHSIGLPKHVRADVELARFRRVQVDVESDSRFVLEQELDDAGVIPKVERFSHGEHRGAAEFVEHFTLAAFFGRWDEQQMAGFQVLIRRQPFHEEGPSFDLFPGERF